MPLFSFHSSYDTYMHTCTVCIFHKRHSHFDFKCRIEKANEQIFWFSLRLRLGAAPTDISWKSHSFQRFTTIDTLYGPVFDVVHSFFCTVKIHYQQIYELWAFWTNKFIDYKEEEEEVEIKTLYFLQIEIAFV